MLDPQETKITLNNEEYIQYAKHLIIKNIGLEGQKRLKQAKVLIIGAGGLGCPAMLYLAASGIGYIGIVDSDLVDISNLNRQILYNFDDVNQSKIKCAKNKLNSINPYCKVITHFYNINIKNCSAIMQYYDIILDATDNFEARYTIDYYCYKLHKIHIYAAVEQFESQISILNYKNNIRYCYIYPKETNLISKKCDNEGVIGIITGHIGILQATEIIKIVLGIKKNVNNYLLICNLLSISIKHKQIYFSSSIHRHKNTIDNNSNFVSEKQAREYFQNKIWRKNIIIIDVRDKYEFSNYCIKYAINIPINQFKIRKTINFLKNYINKKVFIYCNTDYRSIIISNICKQNNICNYIIKNR